MSAPLGKKLKAVKWGNFSISQVFNKVVQGRRLKKDDQLPGNIPFVMSGTTNTGVVGYISNPVATFPANSITVDIFGNAFYRGYQFGAGDDTGVYWNTEKNFSKETMLFFTIAINRALHGKFSYGKKLRSSQSLDIKIKLPITNTGEIDYTFMETFIRELEEERIRELAAYLTASGLTDYHLTPPEIDIIYQFDKTVWGTFNLEKLYGKSTRGKRLKSADRVPGKLIFVTAGEANEGISAHIGNHVEIFPKNTTTIDMFGSAKYRNYEYGADDHVAVVHTENLPKYASIFVTSAIHKAAHTGKFSYAKNFYAKDADELNISLPIKDGIPDYTFMATLIRAVQKLVIKNVVRYTDKKISAYKQVSTQ